MGAMKEDHNILQNLVRRSGLGDALGICEGAWVHRDGADPYYVPASLQTRTMRYAIVRFKSKPLSAGNEIPPLEVSVGSIGSVSGAKGEIVAAHLAAISKAVKRFNELREEYQEDYHEAVEAIEAQGPP